MKILVTGATGKVGGEVMRRLFDENVAPDASVVALCHNRTLPARDRLTIVRGSIDDRNVVSWAMSGVSHVIHTATCKETPDQIMDVAVKGLFWLLEEFRQSPTAKQFILIGGDAGIGHFFHDRGDRITEHTPHHAYPGCYALSKVLEEVMLEQFGLQYGIDWCCLRAPWIMEKDDFKFSLSFGDDVFGGPVWKDLVEPEAARRYAAAGTVPILLDTTGRPLTRNFVHLSDLVDAIFCALDNPNARQQLFNICMDAPVDYAEVGRYLNQTQALDNVEIASDYHSNWMDNAKARAALDWAPRYDLHRLIDEAWAYRRSADDPRKIWYPG